MTPEQQLISNIVLAFITSMTTLIGLYINARYGAGHTGAVAQKVDQLSQTVKDGLSSGIVAIQKNQADVKDQLQADQIRKDLIIPLFLRKIDDQKPPKI